MVPAAILHRLARLRASERGLRLVWGLARLVALVGVLLVVCCLTDWLIDRWEETPWGLRVAMLSVQIGAALAGLWFFVLRPLFVRLSDSELALWVEEAEPTFQHRLITTVQLNRAGADTRGMSPELLQRTTSEAVEMTGGVRFGKALDRRRLAWSAYVGLPVIAGSLALLAAFPETARALLGRQLLGDGDIPRWWKVESTQASRIEPAGDAVTLRFQATGSRLSPDAVGTVRIQLDKGGLVEHYPLVYQGGEGVAMTFTAELPPSSDSFAYRAWLGDARSRRPAELHYEPRPAVASQQVTLLQPLYFDPAGKRRYEERQPKGDVAGLLGSTARVTATFTKPVKKAVLELFGSPAGGTDALKEVVLPVGEKLSDDAQKATFEFDLKPDQTAYRLHLWDDLDIDSRNTPRRTITLLPDEPPVVYLLPERMPGKDDRGSALEDTEVEGLPLLKGERIRLAYGATSPVGLRGAQLRYRINEAPTWETLPLRDTLASPEVGAFVPERGIFEHTGEGEVEFHAVPSDDPARPGRRIGGGRKDFETREMMKSGKLKVRDKVEYYIEVFDNRPTPLVGRSESRVKEVVEFEDLLAWWQRKRRETERLAELNKRQAGLFTESTPDKKP